MNTAGGLRSGSAARVINVAPTSTILQIYNILLSFCQNSIVTWSFYKISKMNYNVEKICYCSDITFLHHPVYMPQFSAIPTLCSWVILLPLPWTIHFKFPDLISDNVFSSSASFCFKICSLSLSLMDLGFALSKTRYTLPSCLDWMWLFRLLWHQAWYSHSLHKYCVSPCFNWWCFFNSCLYGALYSHSVQKYSIPSHFMFISCG